ncbi:Hypothetical protein PBC10988_16940 [Planctomycetales bacterium 10988]|nr:Hypothetical protein PBC10988_16940 [Planctomycetales bacterium 10988]
MSLNTVHVSVVSLVFVVVTSFNTSPSWGQQAHVLMDFPKAIECRDITPEEFYLANPHLKVIEVAIPFSIRIEGPQPESIQEITLEVTQRDARLPVLDFSPRDTLETEYAEPITVTNTDEHTRSVGLGLSGNVPVAETAVKLNPSTNLSMSGRDLETHTVKRKPPQEAVLVSGTMNRGYGVFFKLRANSQLPLEGSREFCVHLAVPREWQQDCLLVTIRTSSEEKNFFGKTQYKRQEVRRAMGLFQAGYPHARSLAMEMADQGTSGPVDQSEKEISPSKPETQASVKSTPKNPLSFKRLVRPLTQVLTNSLH